MSDQQEREPAPDAVSESHAAGPWQAGDPPREGRYLVEYRQGMVRRVFIGDWFGQWSALLDAEILHWAEINDPPPTPTAPEGAEEESMREIEQLRAEVHRLRKYEAAYRDTASRLTEAQEYVSRLGGNLGRNVWHAVLDDAIRLRSDRR
jgi:hypothetical protein